MRENYEKLANAIVLQAVRDYRKALRALSLCPSNRSAQYEARDIERFFRSSYFQTLTNLNPEILIYRLNKGVAA